MKKTLFYIFFLILLSNKSLLAQSSGIGMGDWRMHVPYVQCHAIEDTKNKIYVAAKDGFYSITKGDGSIDKLSTVNGFASAEVKVLSYDPETQKLWIAYENSKIDVVYKNKIYSLDDIFRSSIIGDKDIYDISFHNRRAYISTALGIVVYNEDKMEVSETFLNLSQTESGENAPIYASAVLNDKIYATTGKYIISGDLSPSVNLADFNNWSRFDSSSRCYHLASFQGKLYAERDSISQFWENNSWTMMNDSTAGEIYSIKKTNGFLIFSMANIVQMVRPDGSNVKLRKRQTIMGIIDNLDRYWYVTQAHGLIRMNSDSTESFYVPNGPNTASSFRMINYEDGFWVTAGGYSLEYTHTYNSSGYNILKDNRWLKNPYKESDIFKGIYDFTGITKHPEGNRLFIGTQGKGVIEFEGDKPVNVFNFRNSTLKYFTWEADSFERVDSFTYASGISFDKNGYLWVTNYGNDSALHVFSPDRKWRALKLPTSYVGEMIIDENNYKWIITPRPNLSNNGICVYDDAGTPMDDSDDRMIMLNTSNAELPTNMVRCLAVMPNREIWVGTDAGLVVFRNPHDIFSGNNFKADRIIIEQGGVGGYLLGSESIYQIAVDGGGRRWVATNKGAWLIAKNGMDILKHYDMDNSPLPSNNIYTVGVDANTGEVFFGTDKGLFSVKEAATEPREQMDKLKIFPNPVREDFDGEVAIEGLALDSRVKITDINGNIIYETVSNGGRATWNCRNFSGQRPSSGVYLVFAIDGTGEQKAMGKILFIK